MKTRYDEENAARYRAAKAQAWRERSELFSMLEIVGDVTGLSVVDCACGDGWLTRALKRAGARRILGLDLSPDMIALARDAETAQPLDIDYAVEDARATTPERDCDLVTSNWLLVYARDRAELARMCDGLARQVRHGGRCVQLITNPEMYTWQATPPDFRPYGFEVLLPPSAVEGAPLVFRFHLDGISLDVENYYLPAAAYAAGLADAGFEEITFHPLRLEPARDGADDSAFWAPFLRQPPAVIISATRG